MQLWRYTDDAVVAIIMGVWAFGKVVGISTCTIIETGVEDGYMMMCLGYVFGNIVQRSKIQAAEVK